MLGAGARCAVFVVCVGSALLSLVCRHWSWSCVVTRFRPLRWCCALSACLLVTDVTCMYFFVQLLVVGCTVLVFYYSVDEKIKIKMC